MIVVTLTDCPVAVRGDLSKWLQEINTGVYVGHVSTRVREELWKRVKGGIKSGRATMVFTTNNEQRMDFRVHNTSWEPIDFDGLKLMLRPSPARLKQQSALKSGFSSASQMRKAQQMARKKSRHIQLPHTYLVVHVQTTGPSILEHEICELETIVVDSGEVKDRFHALATTGNGGPKNFTVSRGIGDELTHHDCMRIADIVTEFILFAGNLPVVSHSEDHVYSFLRSACATHDAPLFSNPCIDTLSLSRRYIDDADSYQLDALISHLGIAERAGQGRIGPCIATKLLYEKLIEIM